jgi:3-oxocholest-4-en-26-oyl-CoA dehydrogenase alpha subunit
MNFNLTDQQKDWQKEVRAFLNENVTRELQEELREHEDKEMGPLEIAFKKKCAARGWNRLNWPIEEGGLNLTEMEKFILNEEFLYAGAPMVNDTASSIVAPSLFKYGTEANKNLFLGPILKGEMTFALGYSEPEAGSDLASLKTTATLDGDEWIINGQKTWNTYGHRTTHQWLAARTGDEHSRHRGISLFIVPNDAEGLSMTRQYTWGDHTTNEVFLENVRVPKDYLIGEVNKGWIILTGALDFERIMMGEVAVPRRAFDDALQYASITTLDGELLLNRPDVMEQLIDLEIELEIGQLFGYQAASKLDEGGDLSSDASMMKVFATELYTKSSHLATTIMESFGVLNWKDKEAPFGGANEQLYRLAPFHRFGGGTNEVQRNIVAQRGLGLPRK